MDSAPLVAAAVAILFAVLQWRGIVWGSTIQNLTSLLKALAFIALIVAAFILGGGGSLTTSQPSTTTVVTISAVVISLQSAIYTYDGWSGVIYFSEEVRQSGARHSTRAIWRRADNHCDLPAG